MASSADRQRAYLAEVAARWRSSVAGTHGEAMPQLYAAAAARVRAGEWEHLRPLLRAIRAALRIHQTVILHMAMAQVESRDPSANPDVASALEATSQALTASLAHLEDALAAMAVPGETGRLAGGGPRRGRLFEPDVRSLRGLLDTAVVGAVVAANSVASVVRVALATKNTPPRPPDPERGVAGTQ